MYYGQMELSLLSLALKLGLHPSTLARLIPITSSFAKKVHLGHLHGNDGTLCQLTVFIYYLYVLWRDGTKFT